MGKSGKLSIKVGKAKEILDNFSKIIGFFLEKSEKAIPSYMYWKVLEKSEISRKESKNLREISEKFSFLKFFLLQGL